MVESRTAPRDRQSLFRALPSISALLADPEVRAVSSLAQPILVTELQRSLAEARTAIDSGVVMSESEVRDRILTDLRRLERRRLQPILNATGIIVHTNLGRAPVSPDAARAMADVAGSYTPLELDPETNQRGGRMDEVATLMRLLTGAPATLVVNNNAAAILLVLSALAAGREVVLSRGEAVEIGGGFRIPDVLRQSGATLVEVGTTNRTYARDYAAAITTQTAVFLKVHPSNFRMSGFTAAPIIEELAAVAQPHAIAVIEDIGSGALIDTAPFGLANEPTIGASLAAGAALVTASGDKLLGGPQAGLIVGQTAQVEKVARHPLARAVRADKTCLAGLAVTLRHYTRGEATTQIPVWRMIATRLDELERRAGDLQQRLAAAGAPVQVTTTQASIGGGALPGETLPSIALAINAAAGQEGLDACARRLRLGTPGVFGRIENDRLLLDLRTVLPEDDDRLAAAVVAVL